MASTSQLKVHEAKCPLFPSFGTLILTVIVWLILTSSGAFADNSSVVDEINLTVPVSCSLSGTGMDTHITELHNTESDSAIGESTITAYCNDLNGFSIYAVGFTNNEYGNNNLVSVTASTTNTIPTGTNTSGNTSSWAMKLTPITNPTPTYPITIIGSTDDTDKTPTTLDYTSFQSVPNEYALVARRKASTDVGANAEGSSFKTTYQAYAASVQAAGTYEGQVKYILVHPFDTIAPQVPIDKQVTISYNALEGHFGDDAAWKNNDVTYSVYCPADVVNYSTFSTPNVDSNGRRQSSVTDVLESHEGELGYFSEIYIPSATKLKLVIRYDIAFSEENPLIHSEYGDYYEKGSIKLWANEIEPLYGSGERTVIVDGDSAAIGINISDDATLDPEHDYGYYVKAYPLNENNENYPFLLPCSWSIIEGEELYPKIDGSSAFFYRWSVDQDTIWDPYELDRNSIPNNISLTATYMK